METKQIIVADGHSRKDQLVGFLNVFIANAQHDNYLGVQSGEYDIAESEYEGEVFSWILQYLQCLRCPEFIEICLARKILQESKNELISTLDDIEDQSCEVFSSRQLLQKVIAVVYRVCMKIQKDDHCLNYLALIPKDQNEKKLSIFAAKNGRQTMEDRHVIIPVLQDYLPDNLQAKAGCGSYYAVFDGHGGTDAASYATCHLLHQLVLSPNYPDNIPLAFKDAFIQMDKNFLNKKSKSGATAVCCLMKEDKIYFAWLGDSEAILVRNGASISVVAPHKPDRCDERARIEGLGGAVIHWGTWRINGQLAVSRAIGDKEYKPLVSSEPDVTTVEVDGSEDFIILACDGLWDTLSYEEAVKITFQEVERCPDNLDGIGETLARAAREKGSDDNISVIVIFLKQVQDLLKDKNPLDRINTSVVNKGISSTCSFVLNNSNKENRTKNWVDTSPSRSNGVSSPFSCTGGDVFNSPSGGMMFGQDPFSCQSVEMEDLSYAEEQFEEGEEFDMLKWEDYKGEDSPMMCSSQSISPSFEEGPQHSSNISDHSDFDSYNEEPLSNKIVISGEAIELLTGFLQVSGNENFDEELAQDTSKSLEEILAECRDDSEDEVDSNSTVECCDDSEDEDDSISTEEEEFCFISSDEMKGNDKISLLIDAANFLELKDHKTENPRFNKEITSEKSSGLESQINNDVEKCKKKLCFLDLKNNPKENVCTSLEDIPKENPKENAWNNLEEITKENVCDSLNDISKEDVFNNLEEIPKEDVFNNLVDISKEDGCNSFQKNSKEIACYNLEDTPQKNVCNSLEEIPKEKVCHNLEQIPKENVCNSLEDTPLENVCNSLHLAKSKPTSTSRKTTATPSSKSKPTSTSRNTTATPRNTTVTPKNTTATHRAAMDKARAVATKPTVTNATNRDGTVKPTVVATVKTSTEMPKPTKTTASLRIKTATPTSMTPTQKNVTATPRTLTATPRTLTATTRTTTGTSRTIKAKPKTATATPRSATATPRSATATPKTTTATQRTIKATPKTATALPRSATATRRSETATLRMSTATPRSSTATPRSATATPRMSTATPRIATAKPKTSTTTPTVSKATPKTVRATPRAAKTTPKTAKTTPSMAKAIPKTVTDTTKTTKTTIKTATAKAKTTTTTAKDKLKTMPKTAIDKPKNTPKTAKSTPKIAKATPLPAKTPTRTAKTTTDTPKTHAGNPKTHTANPKTHTANPKTHTANPKTAKKTTLGSTNQDKPLIGATQVSTKKKLNCKCTATGTTALETSLWFCKNCD